MTTLTPRQREIAALVVAGLHNKEIAERLGVLEGTVRLYLHNIYDKTGLKDRRALAIAYIAFKATQEGAKIIV